MTAKTLHHRSEGLTVGSKVMSGPEADSFGQRAAPGTHPLGSTVHNIELKKGRGGQIARSMAPTARLWPKTATMCM